MQNNLLYAGSISFALGIALHSVISPHPFVIAVLVLLSGVFFVSGICFKKLSSGILLCAFLLSFFTLGIVRYHISDLKKGDRVLESLIAKKVLIEGVITEEPDERENNIKLTVNFEKAFVGEEILKVKSRGIITADFYPKFHYGDKITLVGTLEKPENFTSDLGKEFNYIAYLAKDGIYYSMFRPTIKLISSGEGNFLKEKIFAFKELFLKKITKVIPEPEASLSGGLLLGTKQSLGTETLDDFRRVGLIHIVVLSGYNITIVAEFFMKFLALFLSRTFAGVFGIVGIILFAVMTGAGATVVRASLMVILVIVAKLSGRTYDVTRALFLAGFIMLLLNPKILIFDPSFQLSFTAMLGLVHVSPIASRYLKFFPERFDFRELAASTLATQIFVLPLILYMMGNLSLVALPVNLLVLVFVPITMLMSFVTGAIGFIFSTVSIPFGFLAYLLLAYIIRVVELFAKLPFASVTIPHFPLWLMIIVYMLYGYFLWKMSKKSEI